jgi:hypothetical protein
LGAERLLFVLNKPEYPLKNKWLFSYYEHLPIANIHSKDISALCDLYEESDLKCCILDLDDLLKYESIQKGFVADIVQIIIRRASKTPQFVHLLFFIFQPQPHTEINKTLNSVFLGKFKLLGDAYIALDSVQNISDDKGKIFSTILDNDPTFIDRYLKASQSYRSYSFIWERNDYVNIMQRVTSFVFENECDSPYFLYFSYYESFYNKDVDHPETDSSILEKQNDYLLTEIKSKSDDNKYMQFLFSVISSFSLQRKVIFYKAFLEQNKKLDDFKKLPFEPSGGWSPCRVPSEKERIGFYEEVIKLCNSLQLLRHTVDIEKKIRAIRAEIQSAKKKDFMEA